MKWSTLIAAFAASAVVANPVPAVPAKPDPDPSTVWIDSVTYGGSGCPQGSASISLAADRKSFTVILDAYVVSVGPGIGIAEARKNCQLNIQLHYPSGFQYSLLSSDYRGYVELEKGVTGTQKANYYFAGSTNQASIETKFKGPISQDYLIHDEIPFTSTVWSPCGEYAGLNINSQVRVENSANSKAGGFLTTDSIDGKVTFKVGVVWQEC